jgi:predicted  nucleic acid-binding Zn-ribbon protein
MAALLADLLTLQKIERKLSQVRSRLRIRTASVSAQQKKIDDLQDQVDSLEQQCLDRRKQADSFELTLKESDERVSKLRGDLHSAKSNKEYSALLTQINTLKADNAKIEDQTLKIMQEIETLKSQAEEISKGMESEQKRLEDVKSNTDEEIQRLTKMKEDLEAQREQAAKDIDPESLAVFDRIAESYDGEAMAPIEIHGKKPPHSYVCGGCYMGLTPEHANALGVRDEIRTCDNCGRILYLESHAKASTN